VNKLLKLFFGRSTKTWRKVVIRINATNMLELVSGAWWVSDALWTRTGAPMYFARYSTPGDPVMRVELRIDLQWTKDTFWEFLIKSPNAPVTCEVISVEPCEGSIPHAQAWALAMSLRGAGDKSIRETLHWFYNMIGYSYLEEAHMACEHASEMIAIRKKIE
jgi:hypothetical protein